MVTMIELLRFSVLVPAHSLFFVTSTQELALYGYW